MWEWLRLRSFRVKLIALVLLAEALTLGGVLWQGRLLLEEQLREQVRQKIEQINPLLSAALALPMAQRDYAAVDDIVRQAMSRQTLVYLVVESQGLRIVTAGMEAGERLPPATEHIATTRGQIDVRLPINLYGEKLGMAYYGISLTFLDDARQRLQAKVINIGLGGAVLVLVMLGPLAFWLGRRLARLEKAADALAAGQLERRIDALGDDEIDRLGHAFNRMADSLSDHIAEVDRLNAELEERVRVRTEELTIANRELESFSYSVSHDLSTPLRSIDGFSHLIEEDYGDRLDDTGRDYLQRVRGATRRMQQIIDGLLSLSRVTRNEMSRTHVSLSAMAEEILAELREHDPERTVQTRVAADMDVQADPRLLHRAVENLLRNAWKFTAKRPDAAIEVGTETISGETVYFIRDNGAGFDMAYADKLFQAFQRLHESRQFEGSGIGLAIVERVILRHGGRIWAEGQVGAGAIFRFTLPD